MFTGCFSNSLLMGVMDSFWAI